MRSYTAELANLPTPRPVVPPAKDKEAPRGAVVLDARPAVGAPPPVAARPAPPPPVESKIHVLEHPLAQQALTVLRSRQTPSHHFRKVSNQLLTLLVMEATRQLPSRQQTVDTFAGPQLGSLLARPLILLTLARHGLGLAHNLAETFPELHVGSISLERPPGSATVAARLHLANAPALADAQVLLFDPVVASGGTAQAAISLAQRCGASRVTFVSLLFSLPGLSHLQTTFPDLHIWTAGIDTTLDAKRGPLPGLGNFPERFYGQTGREHLTSVPW